MARHTISVDVDVDLDEFDNSDLISEIKSRIKYKRFDDQDKAQLIAVLQGIPDTKTTACIPLVDLMLAELFNDAKQRLSFFQIQERLSC